VDWILPVLVQECEKKGLAAPDRETMILMRQLVGTGFLWGAAFGRTDPSLTWQERLVLANEIIDKGNMR